MPAELNPTFTNSFWRWRDDPSLRVSAAFRDDPVLAAIRLAALERRASPEAVLAALLARIAASAPHTWRAATGERECSLNTLVAVIGPSGCGKTLSLEAASELLPQPGSVARVCFATPEGLRNCYFEHRKSVRTHWNVSASTHADIYMKPRALHPLCEMWHGRRISGGCGQTLEAGSYALGLTAHLCPVETGFLGKHDGAAARFLCTNGAAPLEALDYSYRTPGEDYAVTAADFAHLRSFDPAPTRIEMPSGAGSGHTDRAVKTAALLAVLRGNRRAEQFDLDTALALCACSEHVRKAALHEGRQKRRSPAM